MFTLRTTSWAKFGAKKYRPVLRNWLREVGKETRKVFTAGMKGRHTGRIYARKNGFHRASVNRTEAEYPANDTGGLLASLRTTQQGDNSVTTGTNKHYARFLRQGTGKMRRRRMTDTALKEGGPNAAPHSRGWVQWNKGR